MVKRAKSEKTTKSKSKIKMIERRAEGIRICAGGKSAPFAYVVYQEWYSDGTTKLVRGHSLHTLAGSAALNARGKKQKEYYAKETRPDLYTMLHAAALLVRDIEDACLGLDEARGTGESKLFSY